MAMTCSALDDVGSSREGVLAIETARAHACGSRDENTMTPIDATWLEAFDKALLHLFAIDHADAGMDACLLGCYADLPPYEAALAFGSDYDLDRDDALWPRPGVALGR